MTEETDVVCAQAVSYGKKTYCNYKNKYWYAKRSDSNYYRIGCNKKYTVKNSGVAAEALSDYRNAISKCNGYYNSFLSGCAKLGIDAAITLNLIAINIAFPEAVIVEVIIAVIGLCDVLSVVKAVYAIVVDGCKMFSSYDKVKAKYNTAKKYGTVVS